MLVIQDGAQTAIRKWKSKQLEPIRQQPGERRNRFFLRTEAETVPSRR